MNVMRFRVHQILHPELGPDQSIAHDLLVLPADRMRAERMSTQVLPPSQRGPGAVKSSPESWVLLWLFCAATRLHLTDGAGFDSWADTVLDYDRLDADGNVAAKDGEPVQEAAVDPTQTAGSTS